MAEVNHQILGEAIAEQFGRQVLSLEESYGTLDVVVDKSIIIPLIHWLKNHQTFIVNFLTSLCGVHFPEQKGRELSVVYHLHSLMNNIRFRIHVFLPASHPEIPTLTTLFAGATWMERETFEFPAMSDLQREIWARVGGKTAGVVLLCITVPLALVICGPFHLLQLVDAGQDRVAGLGWAGVLAWLSTTGLGLVIAHGKRDPDSKGAGSRVLDLIARIAPWVFIAWACWSA